MNQITRQKKIAELVNKAGECSVEFLAQKCQISEITIRRDLQVLAGSGKIMRTHGGAAVAERVTFEFKFLERSHKNIKAKSAIADRAVRLVGDGQSVILGAGTTTLELAKRLKIKNGLTVITTSLPIASELQFYENIEVLLIGGFLRHGSPDLTGALTEANLENLNAEIAFLGADAIDSGGGIYDNSINVARMLSKMVASAESIYAVADNSKIGKKALVKYSDLSKWNGLITDTGISKGDLNKLKRHKVKVIPAK